jgi:hypothetical protein
LVAAAPSAAARAAAAKAAAAKKAAAARKAAAAKAAAAKKAAAARKAAAAKAAAAKRAAAAKAAAAKKAAAEKALANARLAAAHKAAHDKALAAATAAAAKAAVAKKISDANNAAAAKVAAAAKAAAEVRAAANAVAAAAAQAAADAKAAKAAVDAQLSAAPTLVDVAASNLNLQKSLLSSLAAAQGATPYQTGYTGLPGATTAALTSLPFMASSTAIRANTGPALVAASAYVQTGTDLYLQQAISAFDILIANQRQVNGSLFSQPTAGDIDTMFFAANLGTADLLLHSHLDAAHQASWDSAVSGAADFLINNGNLRWYTNGNITIGNALVEALAYRITGESRFLTAYETAWNFATAPDQARWTGWGFQVTKQPLLADGSDGTGYFAESGAYLGYDPDYSMLQSELLARLFSLNRDPRVLRVLNMETNQLMLRVNKSTMMLDASGGSRHNYLTPEPFDSSAISVLAFIGGRTDLVQYTYAQNVVIRDEFELAMTQYRMGDRGLWAIGAITSTIAATALPLGEASSYADFVAKI